MSSNTLFDKVWDRHTVRVLPNGLTQLAIGRHYIHEVTSPPAFKMLRDDDMPVAHPELATATVDHIVPTTTQQRLRPFQDGIADKMLSALQSNCSENGITLFDMDDERQGIVHVIGPEQGLTQPGMTIVCGDSHTSTHGAFGAIAFGIGTTQAYYVLATQSLLVNKPKVRRINIVGKLAPGVTAKDVILYIIGELGVSGGKAYAYEYGGDAIERMNMDQRMTVCNMSIEGGTQFGYINPDETTIAYLQGRPAIPKGQKFEVLKEYWMSIRSDPDATYDDVKTYRAEDIASMVTWGTNPGQVVAINGRIPANADPQALKYMGFSAGQPVLGIPIQHAFIGSCTNGRMTDLEEAVGYITRNNIKVAPGVKAYVVPGSATIRREATARGYGDIFVNAGFEWRLAGCSSCLGMNPDTIPPEEICLSSSNRNFEGRQGEGARTMLAPIPVIMASVANARLSDPSELIAA